MGSRGALVGLSLVAMALAVVLVLGGDGPQVTSPQSTRIVPEASSSAIARIAWRRPGAPDLVVEGGRVVEPVAAAVDPDAMDDVRGALELLSFARVGDGRAVEPVVTVVVELDGHGPIELRIGTEEGETGKRWVQRDDGPAYLVDAWAARALDRTLGSVRAAVLFRTRGLTGVEVDGPGGSVLLVGESLAVRVGDGVARADGERLAALGALLRSARMARFADGDGGGPVGLEPVVQVRTRGEDERSVAVYGACPSEPSQRLAVASVGVGCIDGALADALAALSTGEWIDRAVLARPVHDVAAIEVGGTTVQRRGATWRYADGAAADADAVRAWLDALADARVERVDDAAGFDAASTAVVDGATVAVDRSGRRLRRGQEPVVLVLSAPVSLTGDFRERQIFSYEPSGLRRVRRGDAVVERGETLEEWRGAANAEAVRAYRDVVARLRAEAWVDDALGSDAVRHELVFDGPPGGEEVRRWLDIDRECRARTDADDGVFRLKGSDCRILRRHW